MGGWLSFRWRYKRVSRVTVTRRGGEVQDDHVLKIRIGVLSSAIMKLSKAKMIQRIVVPFQRCWGSLKLGQELGD